MTSSSSEAAATSASRSRSPSPPGACDVGSTTSTRPPSTRPRPASCRSTRTAPRSCCGGCSPTERLAADDRPHGHGRAEHVVVVIGTPVDEHLNPDPHAVTQGAREAGRHLPTTASSSCCAAPSTRASPGASSSCSPSTGSHVDVAFCPERIAEGKAMEELFSLPQIVSGRTPARPRAGRGAVPAPHRQIVELEPEEAELAKLFTNTWRYIKFAAANQFYMMANDHGLDFDRIRKALAARLPARRRHARRRVRGRTVPVQGHDAAGGVQRQLVHPRPRRDARQRGAAALRRLAAREEVRPANAHASASSAWRSRPSATTSAPACPTS